MEETNLDMRMLYDSDRYVVVWFPISAERPGFEIVDKAVEAETFLHGDAAAYFNAHIEMWKAEPPSQSEVEELLAQLTSLALQPLVMH